VAVAGEVHQTGGYARIWRAGRFRLRAAQGFALGVNASIRSERPRWIRRNTHGRPTRLRSNPRRRRKRRGILLEAPHVVLDSGALLIANGGAGTNGVEEAGTPAIGRTPSLGKGCAPPMCTKRWQRRLCQHARHRCPIHRRRRANSSSIQARAEVRFGYIRINTTSGIYTQANDAFESPVPSTGTIATR